MSANRYRELAEFLRTRRAAVTPEQAGVLTGDTPRRVPGLRREEVAQLAGVSVTYYTRIEQGEGHQMSDSVIAGIAGALRLSDSERFYLHQLARPALTERTDSDSEQVRPSILTLVESNTDQAVVIVGRRMDLLGGNRLGFALYGLHPTQRPNLARLLILEPAMRDLHVDWEHQVGLVASYLRMASSGPQKDAALVALVGELAIKSPAFAAAWAGHPVGECAHGARRFDHPLVGRLVLDEENLILPGSASQRIIFLGASAGSPSADALRMLDSLVS